MPKISKSKTCKECGAKVVRPTDNGTCPECGAECCEVPSTPAGEPSALARMLQTRECKECGADEVNGACGQCGSPTQVKAPAPNGRDGKVKRQVQFHWTNGAFTLVSIWQEERPGKGTGFTMDYLIERKGAGFWILEKLDPTSRERYVAFVGSEDAQTCSCKGNQGHGHCKHVDAIRALIARGKLS